MRLPTVLMVFCLTACGGKSFDDASPDDSGGSSSRGGAGNTAGKSAAGGAQGGAGPACESFDDDVGAQVSIEIVNATKQPLYLGDETESCGIQAFFDVEDENGLPLPAPSFCGSPCESVREQGELGCGPICLTSSAILLQPGERFSSSYSGLVAARLELPQACVLPPDGIGTCEQARRIRPGNFTFSARAGSSADCGAFSSDDKDDKACVACQPGDSGGCIIPGSLIAGEIRSAKTTLWLDESYGIYPDAETAPAPGGSGAARPVEIVFSD
jgi:hypothetical protein